MKKTTLTLLTLAITTLALFAQRDQGQSFMEYYTQRDKLLHAGAGFAIGAGTARIYAVTRPNEPLINAYGWGVIVGWGVAGLKEVVYDDMLNLGNPDAGDFYATAMAAAVGAGVEVGFQKWQRKRYKKKRNKVVTDFATGQRKQLKL